MELLAISIYEVIIRDLDVRIEDCGDEAAFSFDLSVHLLNVGLREVLRVEAEVFVAIGVTVLLGPLDVHDEDIDWEVVISEVLVALPEDVGRDDVPLGEVEAKGVAGR